MKKPTAALYLRSSKDRKDVSIDAQRAALLELAEARGIRVVAEYSDAVLSGKDEDRPGFQSLIEAVRRRGRGWDTVLVLDTSRIARRRHIGIVFEEYECRRNGVRVVYKSLPDSEDAVTEMLLKSLLQAMDEWHSLTSRQKGLAGMAENVRQGWRAGGRAPRGYVLEKHGTGTIREGAEVMKSKLAVHPTEGPKVATYLAARAAGVLRPVAMRQAGLDIASGSAVDMERNALVYAGHTVWNRHAEDPSATGAKMRPRSEWVIQRDTHPALITEEQAEALLALADSRRMAKPMMRADSALLTGLLKAPDGKAWWSDGPGAYRYGKAKRVSRPQLDRAVIEAVFEHLQGPVFVRALTRAAAAMAKQDAGVIDLEAAARELADVDARMSKLMALVTEVKDPAPLLRQVETLEVSRNSLIAKQAELQERSARARGWADVNEGAIKVALRGLAERLADSPTEQMREVLVQLADQVTLDPANLACEIRYRVKGSLMASPRRRIETPLPRLEDLVVTLPIPFRAAA